MDISLALKAFGSTTVVDSVEKGLDKFIEIENLKVGCVSLVSGDCDLFFRGFDVSYDF